MQASLGIPPEHNGPISWELVRDALLLLYAERREADLTRLETFVAFWRAADPRVGGWPAGEQLDRLLQWLNVRPLGRSRKRLNGTIDVLPALTPPLNRAASNIHSELLSALEGKQYADAARILVASDAPHADCLVSAPEDDQLFYAFRVALRLLTERSSGLGEALLRQVGPADQLKIEQALARGDAAAVEVLPLQYYGTPAAALPCQWLGDRALAAADLAQAISWYDEGLRWASPAEQPELAARKRLVSAMLGSAQGQPPTQGVSLGGEKVAPERFEGWIRDQLSRPRVAAETAAFAASLPLIAAPRPVQFQAAPFGELDDFLGRGFKPDELPGEFRGVDWSWRHLGVWAGDDSLLAVERSRITAFALLGGKPRWDFHLRNAWSPGPVRPLVCGQRIYIRDAATPDRAGVVCLDSKTGRKLWLGDCGGTAASDPIWYHGRLFVFTIGPAGGQFESPLCLVELHPESGDVLFRQPILETGVHERASGDCQATPAGNRLVVLAAGSVIVTDLQGRIVWLRQETTLPYAIDPAFMEQHWQPPIESEGRLFVQQPGSCAIDCLALETGQRRWQRGIVGLQQIIDLPDDRLLARTTQGLVALSKTTGEVLWQREFPGMLAALARTTSGLMVYARQTINGNKPQLVFLWIDGATGQTRAHGTMPVDRNQANFFGPIAARGDRIWCCLGSGVRNNSPTAENLKRIIELRPGQPAAAGEAP